MAKKPTLPGWLSWPVVVCALPVALAVTAYAVTSPASVLLSLVPLAIVLATLWWLDRVEPEPRSSLVHSFLWGATVVIFVSSLANGLVEAVAGARAAALISAPLVEEAMKGLGIYWAVRRKELDGVVDGVIYAGWVAAGFAVVENVQYFATADAGDQLLAVFLIRGLLTPFAHPLFTFWTGVAAGLAVERGRSVPLLMLGGYGLAVVTHAAWNSPLWFEEWEESGTALAIALVSFVALFSAVVVGLARIRLRERRLFIQITPTLVERYSLTEAEVDVFSSWRRMLGYRRTLSKSNRRKFDGVHSALARLALLHSRPRELDPMDEARLVASLNEARSA